MTRTGVADIAPVSAVPSCPRLAPPPRTPRFAARVHLPPAVAVELPGAKAGAGVFDGDPGVAWPACTVVGAPGPWPG